MKKGRGLKIGVVGVGVMGEHHARICSTLPGAKLAGISDLNFEKAASLGNKYSVPAFSALSEMLPAVDAVSIVTPTSTHFEVGVACLGAGKHCLIEKPLCGNSLDAKKLSDLSREKGLVLAVGHIERFNPAFVELQKLVRKEKIVGINIHRLSPFPERISDANVIQDMLIHDLDLLLSLLPNDEIESIKAKGKKVKSNNLDQISATVFFKSGIICNIEASRIFGSRTRNFSVTTDNYIFEADLLNKKLFLRDLKHNLPSVHAIKTFDQLTAELSNFVFSIKKNVSPKVSGEDGYRAVLFAEQLEAACS